MVVGRIDEVVRPPGGEEDGAELLEELPEELPGVPALLREGLDPPEDLRQVVGDHVGDQVAEDVLGGLAEDLPDHLPGDPALGRPGGLVQQRQGVPDGALGVAGDESQGVGIGLDPLLGGDPTEMLPHGFGGDPAELEALAPGDDRRGQLVGLGGAEDEDDVGRRLLEHLQQRVEGRVRELVGLVDDVDLVAAPGRGEGDPLADLPDVVDRRVGRGVHLVDVEGRPVGDLRTGSALPARLRPRSLGAVQALGEDPRRGRLPRPPGTAEEVGVGHTVVVEGAGQGLGDVGLPEDLVEAGRAPLAVQGDVAHGRSRARVSGRLKPDSTDPEGPTLSPYGWGRRPGDPAAPGELRLPLLPPGPGGIHGSPSRGNPAAAPIRTEVSRWYRPSSGSVRTDPCRSLSASGPRSC